MKNICVAVLLIGVALLAGCGDSIHWLPGNGGSSGAFPSPPPPGGTITDVQADTVTKWVDTYTVAFGNITSSTTTTSISITGDANSQSQYSVNDGTPTDAAGTVKKGDKITVFNTSSNYGPGLSISSKLIIGGASAIYTSTNGRLVFVTKKNAPLNTANYASDLAIMPLATALPGTFSYPATVKIDTKATTATNSSMWIGGAQVADNATINANQVLQLKHTTAATSGTTVTTAVIITPQTSGGTPYTVTFKSTTQ